MPSLPALCESASRGPLGCWSPHQAVHQAAARPRWPQHAHTQPQHTHTHTVTYTHTQSHNPSIHTHTHTHTVTHTHAHTHTTHAQNENSKLQQELVDRQLAAQLADHVDDQPQPSLPLARPAPQLQQPLPQHAQRAQQQQPVQHAQHAQQDAAMGDEGEDFEIEDDDDMLNMAVPG